jgi:thiol-disulfide isomerase/thioredoxin
MKNIFKILIVILSVNLSAQEKSVNTVVLDKSIDMEVIIGKANEQCIELEDVFLDAKFYYENYIPKKEIIDQLRKVDKDFSAVVYFGSWCGDSQQYVPIFMKIAKDANLNSEKIEYFGVNRMKKIPNQDIEKLKIEFVPTFIFYKDDKEIGRIVESPLNDTLEEDILNLLKK